MPGCATSAATSYSTAALSNVLPPTRPSSMATRASPTMPRRTPCCSTTKACASNSIPAPWAVPLRSASIRPWKTSTWCRRYGPRGNASTGKAGWAPSSATAACASPAAIPSPAAPSRGTWCRTRCRPTGIFPWCFARCGTTWAGAFPETWSMAQCRPTPG